MAFKQFAKIAEAAPKQPFSGSESFASVLKETLQNSVDQVKHSESLTTQHALGSVDLTQLTTEVAKTSVNVELLTAIREKSIAAYQDFIKMSI